MNLKFEKKEYVAPMLTFIDMRSEMYLLAGSPTDDDGPGFGVEESDDEFGFNLNEGADRIA